MLLKYNIISRREYHMIKVLMRTMLEFLSAGRSARCCKNYNTSDRVDFERRIKCFVNIVMEEQPMYIW